MLSALRLACRQTGLLCQVKWTHRTLRLLQKSADEDSIRSSPVAAIPTSPAASASEPTAAAESDGFSTQQIHATFDPLGTVFNRCRTVEQLLLVPTQREMRRMELLRWLTVVATMAAKQSVPAKTVTSHQCYLGALTRLDGRVEHVAPQKLLQPAQALLDLGVPPTDPVLSGLVNDLIWSLRKMTMRQLIQSFTLSQRLASTDRLLRQLHTLSLETIQRRWVEIGSADEIILIFKNSAAFTPEFLRHVEDRAIEVAGQIPPAGIARLLGQLASQGHRPLPLLRSLTFHAARHTEPITVKDCARILFALQKLNFPDQGVLEKMGNDLVSQLPSVDKAQAIGPTLTAAGLLRWRNTEFLESSANWFEKHIELCRPQEAVSLLVTLATVNFRPRNIDRLVPLLLDRCPRGALPSAQVWLDLVWSSAVLGRATPQLLASVLDAEFCRQLISGPHTAVGVRLKLLNVAAHAAARQDYSGPYLPPELLSGVTAAAPRSKESEALQKSVLEALVNFLPPPKYLRVDVPPSAGLCVDAEFTVKGDGTPVPCLPYGSALPTGTAPSPQTPDLPPGIHRVALCTWTYRDFTLDSVELTGYNRIVVDLLKSSGYRVLEVSHAEFRQQDPVVPKVKMLRQKIKDLVSR